jgi:antitoxin component of MazEF toxin-antitoxin module
MLMPPSQHTKIIFKLGDSVTVQVERDFSSRRNKRSTKEQAACIKEVADVLLDRLADDKLPCVVLEPTVLSEE